jgi:hypothetical protein
MVVLVVVHPTLAKQTELVVQEQQVKVLVVEITPFLVAVAVAVVVLVEQEQRTLVMGLLVRVLVYQTVLLVLL